MIFIAVVFQIAYSKTVNDPSSPENICSVSSLRFSRIICSCSFMRSLDPSGQKRTVSRSDTSVQDQEQDNGDGLYTAHTGIYNIIMDNTHNGQSLIGGLYTRYP